MAFQYAPFVNPQVQTITEILARRGDPAARAAEVTAQARARAAEIGGQAWAGAVKNIGSDIQGVTQQIEQNKREAPRRALEGLQVQSATQAAQDDMLFRHAISLAKGDDLTPAVDFLKSQGGVGIGALQKLSGLVKQQQDQHDESAGEIGFKILSSGADANAVTKVLKDAVDAKKLTAAEAQQFADMTAQDPSKIPDAAKALMSGSPTFRALLGKVDWGKPGDVGVDPITHKPIPGLTIHEKPVPITPEQAKIDSYIASVGMPKGTKWSDLSSEQQAGFKAYSEPKPPPRSLDEQLFEAITKGDKATADTLTNTMRMAAQAKGDPSATAAADRQIAAINAQAGQQRRAQDFTQLQAARTDIDKNVQTPYLTAQSSANTLRDVVNAAQRGNKVAASLQALETTMSAIRAQGLNRINKTETDMAGNAGSMFDRIQGWIDKKAVGQPVPPDIQKDMLEFSDILENAAYKKYLAGHKASTDLYGVTGTLKPTLTAPTPTSGLKLTPGLSGLENR